MKLIIAGSRDIHNEELVKDALFESGFDIESISEIITGQADGVDEIGERIANEFDIPFNDEFDYNQFMDEAEHPRQAPLLRNKAMADRGDALLAVHNGSSGTMHMIKVARDRGLTIHEERVDISGLSDFS